MNLWSAQTMLAPLQPAAMLQAIADETWLRPPKAGAWRYCWRNPPCPSFDKGGDPKAPFCKGGRAQREGIWKRCGNEENIRQQYHCQSTATTERRERTALGYRRWLSCHSQTEDECVHTDVSLTQ